MFPPSFLASSLTDTFIIMEEYTYYDTLSNKMKFKRITSCKHNQKILRLLMDNNDKLQGLYVTNVDEDDEYDDNERQYISGDSEEMGWLGYFLGKNTSLQEFYFLRNEIHGAKFYSGLSRNKSIRKIGFYGIDLSRGNLFQMVESFLKNNHNLIEFRVGDCELGTEDARQLSLALGSCNKSLKHFRLAESEIEDAQLADIILALSVHPQLEKLDLPGMSIRRNECAALATLLRNTTKHLQHLNLRNNNIGDDGIEDLTYALASGGGSELKVLNLGSNPSITTKGWKIVSTLLEIPGSNLEALLVSNNNVGKAGAVIFANALRGNRKLEELLGLHDSTNNRFGSASRHS